MRKIILEVAVTLDGFIEGPNGEYDWCFADPDEDYGLKAFLTRIDALFMGRKTYELLLSMGENGMPGFSAFTRYIFSTTLSSVGEGEVLINQNAAEEALRLKNSPGKDIWLFGGAQLTEFLLNEGLVDELSLAVHPILLGSGKPLFHGIKERVALELISAKPYPSGLVKLSYAVKPKQN